MSMLQIGTMVGRYRLDAELESSDIIQAFRAYDVKLERSVILKIVTHSRGYSTTFTDYFLKEARTLAQLSHANITKVLDFGRDEGFLYLVMENVTGSPLSESLGKKMDWRSAVELILPIASALAYAHDNNVIHRDLKPEIISINAEGHPVLSDFSIARIIEDEETRELTGTNAGLGTPAYMSPEQGKGMPVDYRADIYSLGIIFYELVTGQPPFSAENSMEVLIQQVMTPPPPPTKWIPDLPGSVERVILTALKKDPDERFQSMDEFITAMEMLRSGKEFRSAPRKRPSSGRIPAWAAIGIFLAIIAFGGFAIYHFVFREKPAALAEMVIITPTSTLTPTPIATSTPTITLEPTATLLPSTPTALPLAKRRQFLEFPRIEGQRLTNLKNPINPSTVEDIQEVYRFGYHPASYAMWSADDSSIVLTASNGLYFYNPRDLSSVQGFFGTSTLASCMAMSADESLIAIGDESGAIFVLDAMTGKELFVLDGHERRVTSLAFSNDARKLVSGSEDLTLRIWDMETGGESLVLRKHSLKVNAVAYSTNGNWIISGSDDFHVTFWDPTTGEIIDDRSYGKRVTSLALTRNDSVIAVGLSDTTTQLWNIEGKRLLHSLKDTSQTTATTTVSFSPNGSLLVTGAEDGIARIWNVSSGDKIEEFSAVDRGARAVQPEDFLLSTQFSNDGTHLLTHTRSSLLRVWSIEDRKAISEIYTGTLKPNRVEFSTNGDSILIETNDQTVQVRRMADASLLMRLPGSLPGGTLFSPDNTMFVVLRNDVYDLYKLGEEKPIHTLYGFPLSSRVQFLPGNMIFSASSSRSIFLWTTETGLPLNPETFKYEGNCQVAYSNDEEFFAAGSAFGPNINAGAYASLCASARITSKVLNLSRDGQYLALGMNNGSVEIAHSNEPFQTFNYKDVLPGKVLAVAISPDNSVLAASGENGSLVLIDMVTGVTLATLDHHTGPVRDLTFSSDGKMLASCSDDGTVQIWGVLTD